MPTGIKKELSKPRVFGSLVTKIDKHSQNLHYANNYKKYKGYEGLWGRCVSCRRWILKYCCCKVCVPALSNGCCGLVYCSETIVYSRGPCEQCQLPTPKIKSEI